MSDSDRVSKKPRLRRLRKRVADDSGDEDAGGGIGTQPSCPKPEIQALAKPGEGVWQISLEKQGPWGEAHVFGDGSSSYLLETKTGRQTPLVIDGDGSPGSPFCIGEASLVKSSDGLCVWRWASGAHSTWTWISERPRAAVASSPSLATGSSLQLGNARSGLKRLQKVKANCFEEAPPAKRITTETNSSRRGRKARRAAASSDDGSDAAILPGVPSRNAPRDSPLVDELAQSDGELFDDDYWPCAPTKRTPTKSASASAAEALAESDGESSGDDYHPGTQARAAPPRRSRRPAAVAASAAIAASTVEALAESDGESSHDDYRPGTGSRTGCSTANMQELPDVSKDPEAGSWEQDLQNRRGSRKDAAVSFSDRACPPKERYKLPESAFLGGRPIFEASGRVNLNLLAIAYKQIAAAPEACSSDAAARHILWLADYACKLRLVNLQQLQDGSLRRKGSSKQLSSGTQPSTLSSQYDGLIPKFPKRRRQKQDGDCSESEDDIERYIRQQRKIKELKEFNKDRWATIEVASSHEVDFVQACRQASAPTLSFDWASSHRSNDDDDEKDDDNLGLEVAPPREASRQLLKDEMQRAASRQWAEAQLRSIPQPPVPPQAPPPTPRQDSAELEAPRSELMTEEEVGVAMRANRRRRVMEEEGARIEAPAEAVSLPAQRLPTEALSAAPATSPLEALLRRHQVTPQSAEEPPSNAMTDAGHSVPNDAGAPTAKPDSPCAVDELTAVPTPAKTKAALPAWLLKGAKVASVEPPQGLEVRGGECSEAAPQVDGADGASANTMRELEFRSGDSSGAAAQVQDASEPHDVTAETAKLETKTPQKALVKKKQALLLDMFKKALAKSAVQSEDASSAKSNASLPPEVGVVLRRLRRIAAEKLEAIEQTVDVETDPAERLDDWLADEDESEDEEADEVSEAEDVEQEAVSEKEDEHSEDVEEAAISAEAIRQHRKMLLRKRSEARKFERMLQREKEDLSLITDEFERELFLGTSTMSEENRRRFFEVIDVDFLRSKFTPREPAPAAGSRRLFGGRQIENEYDGDGVFAPAKIAKGRFTFLKDVKTLASSGPSLANSCDLDSEECTARVAAINVDTNSDLSYAHNGIYFEDGVRKRGDWR